MTVLLACIYLLLVDHSPLAPGARAADALPGEVEARFHCDPGVPLQSALVATQDQDGRDVLRGDLSFRRLEGRALRRVRFDYHRATRASPGPLPVILISPITGGDYEVSRLLAADLVRHGYHAVIVMRSTDDRALRGQVALSGFENAMRDAIAARRRVIDWLVTREEVDANRIGAYGVSLGAVLTATLAAVDERVVASVVVMGCGDLPALLCRSVEGEARRLARAHGVPANPGPADLAAFEELARPVLVTDPQRLAPYVDPREVFLVMTRRDTSVPTVLQERFRKVLGFPEAISLPTGHYSSAVYLPVILESGRKFLARRFAEVPE